MKILRTLFVLLLCAVLPLTGLAAGGLAGQCPMQMTMSADIMHNGMAGCDSMKPSPDHKSKVPLCKVTAQCQLGNLYHPVEAPVVRRPVARRIPVRFHYAQSLSIREPDGPWRPPRAI